MNKQELINRIGQLFAFGSKDYIERNRVLDLVKQLDKPKPVKVPQCVADWIEKCKRSLSLRQAISQVQVGIEVDDWLMEVDADDAFANQETVARAWLDGYEVEEEKKFFVKIKCLSEEYKYLNYFKSCREWLFSEKEETKEYRVAHTRKQLEEADFGWVFDCPGIEVEEVEG